jgi:thiaminase/transcriptional activator TenA
MTNISGGIRDMARFSEKAWARTAAVRAAIEALPFNRELAAGTLSRERFQFYILQDALYLKEFSRALAIAAAKAPARTHFEAFARSAVGVVAVEEALHERYLAEFGLGGDAVAAAEPSPDCLAYTSYLLAAAYHEPWEVLVAALLPCFWIYREVGVAIAGKAAPGNPYRAWIDTYADERFAAAVTTAIAIADEAGAAAAPAVHARMLAAFSRCCQYEWLFWDGAYQRRGWPVG